MLLQLQDEISTGLDSSTTFLITKCIRNFVHMQDVRTSALGRPMGSESVFSSCRILPVESGEEAGLCVVLPQMGCA